MVAKRFNLLNNFQPHQYLLLKSHLALEDVIGVSILFTKLYSLLMAMKQRDVQGINVVTNMAPHISRPTWLSNGIANQYIHQLMRFASFSPRPIPNPRPADTFFFIYEGIILI